MWTFFSTKQVKGVIERAGIMFGAPGDRRAENGTLWIEYPVTGGRSPTITITTSPEKPEFLRRHSSQISGQGPSWVAGSAAKGLEHLTVDISGGTKMKERSYTVRLHFAELEDVKVGERIFNVALQGKNVLQRFDIVAETAGRMRAVVKEFKDVKVAGELVVDLIPASPEGAPPLLSGIEVIAEGK